MNNRLNRVIVPVGQYVDPNNPNANAGSINHSLDTHPMDHADDYAAHITEEDVAGIEPYTGPDKPQDEWTKDDYKEALAAAELPVSGNKDELEARWNEHMANQPASDEQ